jgi:hypothetical protein
MRVQEHQGEFDPGDPYDAMCESFRIQVADIASEAYRAAIYRDMSPERQLSSFMAGVLTGLIGVCFVSIRDEGRETMMEGIVQALPFARQQAEDIINDALKLSSQEGKSP